ncbi:histone-lysine N-methyltransferase SETMAR [Trichonephila clavipes]|nr:histone-lysine N-methyltransferase SETMAR [Trichonephila clavipes]
MESDKQHFRHILLFYYRKGKNAVQARKKLTDVYGADAPRSGRPVEADKDVIKALVDANRRITTREIGLSLNLSNSTVYDHLKCLGLSSKLDAWVPHVLTERNLCRRIDVCDSLLKRHENDPFLKRIITGDEKVHGTKKMNRLKPFPKLIFTKKRAMSPGHLKRLGGPQVEYRWSSQSETSFRARLKSLIATRGLLATDHVILNHGQVTWTTPELAPPLLTTTPHQREDVSALDRFNVHRCPTRRVFSGTGLELVTKQATVRYLYHSATAATNFSQSDAFKSSRDTLVVMVTSSWSACRSLYL